MLACVDISVFLYVLLHVFHVYFRSRETLHLYWFPEYALNPFAFFTEVHKCKTYLMNTNILFLFMCQL
jgi:hypothetical protein